ncbi:MAG: acyl carrier protein [Nitrospira sp.]|nr:acyl carrier protein [Nitrospira sp.]MBA3753642.1 acyl carrier protein [Nitrospira sp.]
MAIESPTATRIRTALAKHLKRDVRTIAPHASLRDDLSLDSLGTFELLFEIEEVFDLQIPNEVLQKLVTVGDVIKDVEERLRPSTTKRVDKPSSSKRLAAAKTK